MKRIPLSRRTLLKGAGGVAIGLPMLEAMEGSADAAAAGQKKFISFFSGCGVTGETFFPTGTEKSFTLPGSVTALTKYKDKMIFFNGITNASGNDPQYGGHQGSHVGMISGSPFVLSADVADPDHYEKMRPKGISLDQKIAQKLHSPGNKFASLQLGVMNRPSGNNFDIAASFTGEKGLLLPEPDPLAIFKVIFQDGATSATDTAAADLAHQKRKSILDFIKGRYTALNARLGADDKARIDQHLTSIREIEQQLLAATSASCVVPSKPASGITPEKDLDGYAKLQFDLLAAALACDLTNVASLTWFGTRGGDFNYKNVIKGVTITGGHHGLSHNQGDTPQITAINNYIAQNITILMDSLDKYKTSTGGSLLDTTLILWWNELGFSNAGHESSPAPFVLAGGNGGALKMGRFLDYTSKKQSNNNLLLSVYNAVTDSTESTFGDPRYCTGVLPGFA
ncbi:MAG: DUF1552 domain-containing protein [Chitinophagaceae bacterium]|nr:DUF1552 domain-containing protein [Oligoflexus sp.]